MKRVHCVISGDVVGVGYRAWTVRQARELGITGWVKNREDDTVEIVAEGERLAEFVRRCRKGPDVAWVKDIKTEWTSAKAEFVTFQVVY